MSELGDSPDIKKIKKNKNTGKISKILLGSYKVKFYEINDVLRISKGRVYNISLGRLRTRKLFTE